MHFCIVFMTGGSRSDAEMGSRNQYLSSTEDGKWKLERLDNDQPQGKVILQLVRSFSNWKGHFSSWVRLTGTTMINLKVRFFFSLGMVILLLLFWWGRLLFSWIDNYQPQGKVNFQLVRARSGRLPTGKIHGDSDLHPWLVNTFFHHQHVLEVGADGAQQILDKVSD